MNAMNAGLYSSSRTENLKIRHDHMQNEIELRIRDDPWYVLHKEIVSNLVIQPPGLKGAKSPLSK